MTLMARVARVEDRAAVRTGQSLADALGAQDERAAAGGAGEFQAQDHPSKVLAPVNASAS